MARYPAAEWRRVPGDEPKITPRTVIFHTMVGTLPGTDAYFRSGQSGGVESHFGVGGPWEGADYDGLVYQWRDTEEQADANLDANAFAVSIETSDGSQPSRPWTPAQVDALVALGRWLADTHGIPKRLCASPTDAGFGWHVMWGAPSAWTPVAKTCPGDTRIQQLNDEVLPAIFAPTEEDLTVSEADRIIEEVQKQSKLIRVGDVAGGAVDTHDYSSVEGVGRQVKTLQETVNQILEILTTPPEPPPA